LPESLQVNPADFKFFPFHPLPSPTLLRRKISHHPWQAVSAVGNFYKTRKGEN